MEYRKFAFGIQWQLIFHQDSSSLFKKNTDELFCHNEDNTRYSILETLTEHARTQGFFEFLLEYPVFSNPYWHWKQKINPLETNTSTSDVGYIPLHIPSNRAAFRGLSKSSDNTFLDGTPGRDINSAYYAIASYYIFNNGIPGPYYENEVGKDQGVPSVNLWLRIGTIHSIYSSYIHQTKFFFIFLIIN